LNHHYIIFPLGDSAATIELSKVMSESQNKKILAMQKWIQQNAFIGLKDIIVAYCSLTVVYDPFVVRNNNPEAESAYQWIANKLMHTFEEASIDNTDHRLVHIPVCYDEEFGTDLQHISAAKNLSVDCIVNLHESKVYRVYMLGFLPGFAYLGEIQPELMMPRKESPVPVKAGSVGIVSNQTGIYPLYSPGGWQIIGRTPVKLFNASAPDPVKLRAGDEVQFHRITRHEFDSAEWNES
jgi:inhibitor of KinA